jgi:hypothetical protein
MKRGIYMNKKFLLFCLFGLFLLTICGCKNNLDKAPQDEGYQGDSPAEQTPAESAPERKLIYKVDVRLETKDLEKTLDEITTNMAEDELIYERHEYESQVTLQLRIKSSRLEAFLDSLSESGKVGNLNMTSTDVSLAYQDKTNRITSLNAERARLVELYAEASMSDMILINKRISEIDREVMDLQGTLNEYDSLIDYSEVTLNIYEVESIAKQSFGSRIISGFVSGFKALIIFLEELAVILVTMLPFLAVFALTGIGTAFFYQRHKKRKSLHK